MKNNKYNYNMNSTMPYLKNNLMDNELIKAQIKAQTRWDFYFYF